MCKACYCLDLLRCTTDMGCYEEAVIVSAINKVRQRSSVLPCNNPDYAYTCTDAYSSIRDDPQSCEDTEVLRANFRQIESCMFKVLKAL